MTPGDGATPRALVVVVDDRRARGVEEDSSGPLVAELLAEAGFVVDGVVVVSGDEVEIRNALNTAVIGGVGNIRGAMIGAFILGTTEIMVAAFLPSTYRDFVAFTFLLVLLIGAVFWWSVRSGQFDDLEGPAHRILADDDRVDVAAAGTEATRDAQDTEQRPPL